MTRPSKMVSREDDLLVWLMPVGNKGNAARVGSAASNRAMGRATLRAKSRLLLVNKASSRRMRDRRRAADKERLAVGMATAWPVEKILRLISRAVRVNEVVKANVRETGAGRLAAIGSLAARRTMGEDALVDQVWIISGMAPIAVAACDGGVVAHGWKVR